MPEFDDRAHRLDQWLESLYTADDTILGATTSAANAAGLPPIAVSPMQGEFLQIMARAVSARLILEVGTLGGYSTIHLARGLDVGGRVVTVEKQPEHAAVARDNVERAGLGDRVEVRVGAALEVLPALAAEWGAQRADLVFVDADKASLPEYLDWSLRLSRPGALIILDNVVRQGRVLDAESGDPNVRGVRTALEAAAKDPRINVSVLQTVGAKGYDGMLIGYRTGER